MTRADVMRRLNADPAVLAKRGVMTAEQRAGVEAEILSGRPYIEIADDWLLSPSRVRTIARQIGIRKRKPYSEQVNRRHV